MKKAIAGVFCGVVLSAVALSAGANDAAEEKLVIAALDTMVQATVKKDAAALKQIYHDDLMYSHTSGATQTKAEVISTLMGSPRIVESMTFEQQTIQIHGPVALVKNVTHLRNGEPGKIQQIDLHVLWVLVKGPQGWQVTCTPSVPAARARVTAFVSGRSRDQKSLTPRFTNR